MVDDTSENTPHSDRNAGPEREPRQSRLLSVIVRNDRVGEIKVMARNISEHGLGGRTSTALFVGEAVTLELPGLDPINATVQWIQGGKLGLSLAEAINIGRLVEALKSDPAVDRPAHFEILKHEAASTARPSLTFGNRDKGPGKSKWTER